MSKFRIGETYELIRSLSGHERGYFTDWAEEDAEYYSLYRDLLAMDQFDGENLKERYSNLNGLAKYLYELILKCMRNYRSNNFKSNQIKESLIDNQLLWEKGHYEQCMQKLDKARQDAESLGDLLLLLEVNRQERHIAWFQTNKKSINEREGALAKESLEILDMLQEEIKYYNLYYQLYAILRTKNKLTTPEERSQLQTDFSRELFDKKALPKSPHGQRRFYLSSAIYCRLLGDFEGMNKAFSNTLKWWKRNKSYKEDDSYWYASDLINFIHSYLVTGNFEYCEPLLKKLESLEKKNQHLERFIFVNSMLLQIVYYNNLKRYKEAKKLIPKIEYGLEQYGEKYVNKVLLMYNVSVTYFLSEEYENCLIWSKEIMDKRGPFQLNLRKGIRLMYLACCYEVDNETWDFNTSWKAVKTYFSRMAEKKEDVAFELEVVSFMKKLNGAYPQNKMEVFQSLQDFLQKHMTGNMPSGCEELSLWLDKKMD